MDWRGHDCNRISSIGGFGSGETVMGSDVRRSWSPGQCHTIRVSRDGQGWKNLIRFGLIFQNVYRK